MGKHSMKLPRQDTHASAFGGYLGTGKDGYHLEGGTVVRNEVKFKGPKKHRLFFRRSLRNEIEKKISQASNRPGNSVSQVEVPLPAQHREGSF